MRTTGAANHVAVKGYAGTTGVLLAMNVPAEKRRDLLGFAIEKQAGRAKWWLRSMLTFPGVTHSDGALSPTNEAPIQKFRWSDYGVYPNRKYTYTVHPVYGDPGAPRVEDGPTVEVRTHGRTSEEHYVLFNRAAAASQAFSRDFPEVEAELNAARREKRDPVLPPDALEWLSRGLLEQITGFAAKASGAEWALDVAIYEYELPEIVAAVNAAHAAGAKVRVIYHAKKGDDQTKENEKNLAALPAGVKRARVTSKIFHDKFMVLSKIKNGEREPRTVLCGSTNFTRNGVYRQANVVHVVKDKRAASEYLALFEVIFNGADVRHTRTYINGANPMVTGVPLFAGFSPRTGGHDLETFVAAVEAVERDVLFCTAFNLYDPLEEALLGAEGDKVLRYGLQNSRSTITGRHRDRTADFSATAMLSSGLEGFLKESTKGQRGNILIHTKVIVVDFTSDHPTVISGSHNFSNSASKNNDENFLMISGNPDVADCYGIELMRLYDHYRFRWYKREHPGQSSPGLTPDGSWTDRYFKRGSLTWRDRLAFAGE